MADRLDGYLARARAEPFAWARHDCILFLADWFRELTGRDEGAAWRDLYTNGDGAGALIHARGGLPSILTGILGQPGIRAPRRGDVGLWASPAMLSGYAGMICTGNMWAARRHGGGVMMFRGAEPAMHWSLGFVA